MKAPLALLLLSVGAGCTLSAIDLAGKACDAEHVCPSPLRCEQNLCVRAPVDTACHRFDAEQTFTCPRRDLYVSPTGDNASDGLAPERAWASIEGPRLAPGDRVHLLPGRYPGPLLTGDRLTPGTVTCPIEIFGPDIRAGGALAELTQPIALESASIWLHDLKFSAENTRGVLSANFAGHIRFERLIMRNRYDPASSERDINAVDAPFLEVLSCDFDSEHSEVMNIGGADDALVRGNRFVGRPAAHLELGSRVRVLENVFTGAWGTPIQGRSDPSAIVERNIFHDIICPGGCTPHVVVMNAGVVRGNTFISIDGAIAADRGIFRDNIVSGLAGGSGLSAALAQGGYNLFANVAKPYASGEVDGTDRGGAIALDADFVPTETSPALDASDPSRPVPPGGGSRADIGALERGAIKLGDGRYCTDDGL